MAVIRKEYWSETHDSYEGFQEKILKRNEVFSFAHEISAFRQEGNHLFFIELSENQESYVFYCQPLPNTHRIDTEDNYSQLLIGNKALVVKTAILNDLQRLEMPRIFIRNLGKFELGREEILKRALTSLKKMDLPSYVIWKDAVNIDWGADHVGRDLIGDGDYEVTLKSRHRF